MPLKKLYDIAYQWVNERADLDELIKFLRKKEVPLFKHSVWFYFGGLSLFFFTVQIATGLLLLMYYRPGPESSFESLQFIVTRVKFGWLVREVHAWSANLMIFCVFIHMFSVFFLKAYRKPREMTWMSGMLLLFLALGFGFSGYLLPWNELAFFATKVGTDMAGTVPLVGDFTLEILRGGPDVTGATLSRFFGVHVAILPIVFMGILTVHLLLLQKQGMSQPRSWRSLPENKRKIMAFFPNFALRDLMLWMVALLAAVSLAVFFPWELGVKADPFAPAPPGIRPEWYFMFMFQTLKMLPAHIGPIEGELFGLAVFNLGALVWLLLPLWDKTAESGSGSRMINWLGIIIISFILVMTAIGYAV